MRPVPSAAPEPDHPEHLRDLLARCIDVAAANGLQAVEPLLRAHPEQAEAVRERLRKLARAGLLETTAQAADSIPERLGDFRLVRRLGAEGR